MYRAIEKFYFYLFSKIKGKHEQTKASRHWNLFLFGVAKNKKKGCTKIYIFGNAKNKRKAYEAFIIYFGNAKNKRKGTRSNYNFILAPKKEGRTKHLKFIFGNAKNKNKDSMVRVLIWTRFRLFIFWQRQK